MGNKKRMYKKGSFLEPNKELTFGGMKKGKYEAAGPVARQAESAKKMKAAAERIAAEEASKAAAARRGPSRQEKQNTPQGTGGGAKPQVGSKLKELSNAPGPKPAAKKPASTGPKPGTYAYAKKRNPNLDKLIAERKKYAKGTEDYNRVQNQINRAYSAGPMRKEISKVTPKAAPKNTAKPTLQKPASSKPAASKPAPKPAAKKPTPTKTPSGGSGMGAVAKQNALKKELQSAKPVDRRTSAPATKSTSKKMDRLVKKVKKEDAKMRRKNTTATPEGRRPRAQARRLNRASNASAGVKKMGDNYGGNATKAAKINKMGDALEKDLKSRGMMMGGMKYGMGGKYMNKGGFPDLTGDGKVTFADILKGRLKGKKGKRK